tara:strand:- start:367 stop:627 length:261 start_codon:yes stop_codon:yes gene_type:complete
MLDNKKKTRRSPMGGCAITTAIIFLGSSYVAGQGIRSCIEYDPPKLQTAQLDGSGAPERFYVIDGEVAPVRVNGMPALDYIIECNN